VGAVVRCRRRQHGAANAAPNADPFSLGDPEATASILERAGFEAMRFDDVHEPVLYGHDIDAALEEVLGFQDVNATLAGMSEADARCGVERLRAVLAAHRSGDRGIAVDSRSWLITARRRER
jgi:hypothetical protein